MGDGVALVAFCWANPVIRRGPRLDAHPSFVRKLCSASSTRSRCAESRVIPSAEAFPETAVSLQALAGV